MKLHDALLASALIAVPLAAANAQAVDGLYVGLGAGANFLQRESFTGTGSFTKPGSLSSDAGPVVVVSLGWGFGNGFRAELEGNWRKNDFSSTARGVKNTNEQKFGGMVNGFYDLVGVVPVVQPYVGLGIGYQAEQLNVNAPGIALSGSSKGSFAYQAMLGAALPIDAVPGLAITAEYRFLGLAGNRNYSGSVLGVPGTLTSTNNYNHSILLGVRYAFGSPPPPVAPTPVADAGAKTFLVFFDWNKADLTERSSGIVRDAAAYSTKTQLHPHRRGRQRRYLRHPHL